MLRTERKWNKTFLSRLDFCFRLFLLLVELFFTLLAIEGWREGVSLLSSNVMEEISTYLEASAQVLNTSIKKANRHDAENTINQLYMWGIIFFFAWKQLVLLGPIHSNYYKSWVQIFILPNNFWKSLTKKVWGKVRWLKKLKICPP